MNRPHFAVTGTLALAVVILLLRPIGGPYRAAVAMPGIAGDSACCLPDGTCLDTSFENCEKLGGSFSDHGILCSQITCETCVGDLNGDGAVNTLDLLVLLANWGDCS